jgi:hypothetical protein
MKPPATLLLVSGRITRVVSVRMLRVPLGLEKDPLRGCLFDQARL